MPADVTQLQCQVPTVGALFTLRTLCLPTDLRSIEAAAPVFRCTPALLPALRFQAPAAACSFRVRSTVVGAALGFGARAAAQRGSAADEPAQDRFAAGAAFGLDADGLVEVLVEELPVALHAQGAARWR